MRRGSAQRGATSLETVAALPLLLMLLGVGLDFAFLSLAEHQLAFAAREASRIGLTGQASAAISDVRPIEWCEAAHASPSPRLYRVRQAIATAGLGILRPDGLCLDIRSYGGYGAIGRPEPLVDLNGNGGWDRGEAYTDVNGNGRWDADQGASSSGTGSEVAVYRLRYRLRPLTGMTPGWSRDHVVTLESRLVVRNEPFSNS